MSNKQTFAWRKVDYEPHGDDDNFISSSSSPRRQTTLTQLTPFESPINMTNKRSPVNTSPNNIKLSPSKNLKQHQPRSILTKLP